MTDEEREEIWEGVYIGAYTVFNLPTNLYTDYYGSLVASLNKGYKATLTGLTEGTTQYETLLSFQNNLSIFSGAKTFREIEMLQSFIFDKGVIRPYKEFREYAEKTSEVISKDWLKTEKETVQRQALMARNWQDIQKDKDRWGYIRYVIVGDLLVRPEHAIFDGVVYSVDSPFWKAFYPQNGYNCRCSVEQVMQSELLPGEGGEPTKDQMKEYEANVDKLFQMNPAIDGYIFKTEGYGVHPYILVPEKYEVWKDNNFGLPILP